MSKRQYNQQDQKEEKQRHDTVKRSATEKAKKMGEFVTLLASAENINNAQVQEYWAALRNSFLQPQENFFYDLLKQENVDLSLKVMGFFLSLVAGENHAWQKKFFKENFGHMFSEICYHKSELSKKLKRSPQLQKELVSRFVANSLLPLLRLATPFLTLEQNPDTEEKNSWFFQEITDKESDGFTDLFADENELRFDDKMREIFIILSDSLSNHYKIPFSLSEEQSHALEDDIEEYATYIASMIESIERGNSRLLALNYIENKFARSHPVVKVIKSKIEERDLIPPSFRVFRCSDDYNEDEELPEDPKTNRDSDDEPDEEEENINQRPTAEEPSVNAIITGVTKLSLQQAALVS